MGGQNNMPTGYIAKIANGESFTDFVWDCKNAFSVIHVNLNSQHVNLIPVFWLPILKTEFNPLNRGNRKRMI
jgi:hypothetical protein